KSAEHQQRVAGEQHEAPDESPRLGEYGENKIRVTLREEREPALRGAGNALAQELSRTDRDLGLDDVVRAPERIAKRIQEHEYAFPLVLAQREEPDDRQRGQPRQREAAEQAQPDAGADEQRGE